MTESEYQLICSIMQHMEVEPDANPLEVIHRVQRSISGLVRSVNSAIQKRKGYAVDITDLICIEADDILRFLLELKPVSINWTHLIQYCELAYTEHPWISLPEKVAKQITAIVLTGDNPPTQKPSPKKRTRRIIGSAEAPAKETSRNYKAMFDQSSDLHAVQNALPDQPKTEPQSSPPRPKWAV